MRRMIAECVFKIIEHTYTSRYGKYAWGHYTYQNVEWDFSIWALGSTVEHNRQKKSAQIIKGITSNWGQAA